MAAAEAQHRAIYGFQDTNAVTAAELTEKAVYGLPELNSDRLPSAALVANPGCYATSVILALAPLLAADLVDRGKGIISDSKSGVSGAGKEATARTHFVSVADNLSAYSVFGHRHVGEIVEQLKLNEGELIFTPHLLPIPRGILSTIYVHLKRETKPAEVESCFQDFYAGKPWVRVFATPKLPQIQFSLHTNYCDLGFCLRRGAAAGAGVMHRQPAQGRGGSSSSEYEPFLLIQGTGRFAVAIVIKLGGAALEDKATLQKCAHAIVELAEGRPQCHGGPRRGVAFTRTLKLLGKESDFVNGLRITDAETRDVALMVLAGIVNKSLVAAIVAAGRPAIGLCGGDGMAFRARKKQTQGYDLGYVGEICSVEPRWMEAIWGARRHSGPIVGGARFGWRVLQRECGPDGCGLRCGMPCRHADLPDRRSGGEECRRAVMPWLNAKQISAMVESAEIAGGMLPKLEACGQALKKGVEGSEFFRRLRPTPCHSSI